MRYFTANAVRRRGLFFHYLHYYNTFFPVVYIAIFSAVYKNFIEKAAQIVKNVAEQTKKSITDNRPIQGWKRSF